jgi:hypothetical protein
MILTALRNKEIKGALSGMTYMTVSTVKKGTYRMSMVFVPLVADWLCPPELMADLAR